jgi:hypothetical protein
VVALLLSLCFLVLQSALEFWAFWHTCFCSLFFGYHKSDFFNFALLGIHVTQAYLSLPEGAASAAGLIAMMTDHYNLLVWVLFKFLMIPLL